MCEREGLEGAFVLQTERRSLRTIPLPAQCICVGNRCTGLFFAPHTTRDIPLRVNNSRLFLYYSCRLSSLSLLRMADSPFVTRSRRKSFRMWLGVGVGGSFPLPFSFHLQTCFHKTPYIIFVTLHFWRQLSRPSCLDSAWLAMSSLGQLLALERVYRAWT